MKKVLLSTIILLASVMTASAQVAEPKDTPQLEFALQLKVTLGDSYEVGDTQHGQRIVIPITGGTFEGPAIKGTIINGGLSTVSRLTMVSISMSVTEVSSGTARMPKAIPLSISRLLLCLKHQQTANMPGSTIHSSSAPQTSPNSSRVSSSTSGG